MQRAPAVSRVVGYAYPWDVIGDPGFADRVGSIGIAEVAVAASYHGTRAATPMHPQHRFVNAAHAALYRPVRPEIWAERSVQPVAASWVPVADPFAESVDVLRANGIAVHAWVVLAHSARIGSARPDLAVRNCFGDSYSYALCVAHPEVRDYVTTLAREAVRDVDLAGVSVESCGQLGAAHNGAHEKSDGAYGPAAQRLLSVCCCGRCRRAWTDAGLDDVNVVNRLRSALRRVQDGDHEDDATMDQLIGAECAAVLLDARLAAQDATRADVLAGLRDLVPAARITLHGHPDPWATGPSPAVTATASAQVDAVLVPAWIDAPATRDAIAAARRQAPDRGSVGAYVTALPPADPATIDDHVAALIAAGADELHLYHLGLVNRERLAVLGRLASLQR